MSKEPFWVIRLDRIGLVFDHSDMVRRTWRPTISERTDAEVIQRKKQLAQKLADAVEYGTEEDFVDAVKNYKPEVGKDELKSWIMRFRAAVRAKRGLC